MPIIIKQELESSGSVRDAVGKQDDIDDQFFELTVNDVRSIRRDLIAEAFVFQFLNN